MSLIIQTLSWRTRKTLPISTRFTAPLNGPYLIQGFFQVQDADSASEGDGAVLQIITNMNTSTPVFSANTHGASLGTQYLSALPIF